MTIDAAYNYDQPLTEQRLGQRHTALFPHNASAFHPIRLGAWSTKPIQILSGPIGREVIEYQAPPPERVPAEMERFIEWFNAQSDEDGLVRCAIAHMWFEQIHPFEGGNGRIGRAIADMQLARDEQCPDRYYSISRQIMQERRGYYDALKRASAPSQDVSDWIVWFLGCFTRAVAAGSVVDDVIRASEFWRRHEGVEISDRQRRVLNRFLHGFDGKLTARKWAALAKASKETAQRDIADLLRKGVVARNDGGSKNTSYSLE